MVVMGLNPSLPAALRVGLATEAISTEEYMNDLLRYLRETHRRVQQYAEQLCFEQEGTDRGAPGSTGLTVGALAVMNSGKRRSGADRFGHRTDGEIYKIEAVVGENTHALGKLTTGEPPVANPMYANR